jgi:NAD(P)-dependent dehydrogenase (short-subunit alcohol dehydrogenase family)
MPEDVGLLVSHAGSIREDEMARDLEGRAALVTGATSGIGRATALLFAEAGARVVVSSRKAAACEDVAAEIRAAGGEALVVPCNVSDKAQLQGLVDATLGHWGRIDVLVCNAAVNPYYGPMGSIPDDAFDKILGVNVRSNHWLCQMVLPQMAERRDGAVIVISSIAGLRGDDKIGVYGISKAADMQLVRNLAIEWGRHNIRVNCIAPGLVRTDFARALWEDPEIHARTAKASPLNRLGEPDDIAGAAIFLAADAGRYVTGETLVVDGGVTIGGPI